MNESVYLIGITEVFDGAFFRVKIGDMGIIKNGNFPKSRSSKWRKIKYRVISGVEKSLWALVVLKDR